jgi:hypothetical protein
MNKTPKEVKQDIEDHLPDWMNMLIDASIEYNKERKEIDLTNF